MNSDGRKRFALFQWQKMFDMHLKKGFSNLSACIGKDWRWLTWWSLLGTGQESHWSWVPVSLWPPDRFVLIFPVITPRPLLHIAVNQSVVFHIPKTHLWNVLTCDFILKFEYGMKWSIHKYVGFHFQGMTRKLDEPKRRQRTRTWMPFPANSNRISTNTARSWVEMKTIMKAKNRRSQRFVAWI